MTILVRHPRSYPQERAFAFDAVFESLGVPWLSIPEDRADVELSFGENGAKPISLPDVVFSQPEHAWPDCLKLPRGPLPTVQATWVFDAVGVDEIPVLFGRPGTTGAWVDDDDDQIRFGIDVFGAAFVLLSRLEETRPADLDIHGRFPASASLGYRLGFLDRPLVDEYVELLRSILTRGNPGFASSKPTFTEDPTHDIDFVDGRNLGVLQTLRTSARELITHRAPSTAMRRVASLPLRPIVGPRCDVFNTFAKLMDASEQRGLTSTFYFIAGRATGGINDDNYEIGEPWLRSVVRSIAERGHRIGLHGSYQSFSSPTQLASELEALRDVLRGERLATDEIGCRQHYLRFDVATTWAAQAEVGLAFDSTLAFAEAPGFRSGTCRDHPVYAVATRTRLPIRERPLTVMDTTILDPAYLALGMDEAVLAVAELKRRCRRVGGTFRLLWHNTMLVTPSQRALYREILAC